MTARDYWDQAKFWGAEYPRRARAGIVRSVPPGVKSRVVRAIESQARPRDLNLYTTFPRVSEILVQTREAAPSVLCEIPSLPGKLDEDVYWYPPVRVRELRDVLADANSALLFSRGWVVNGTGTGHRWSMDSAFITGATGRVHSGKTIKRRDPIAILGNVIEHYHFMLETLPQALRIKQAEPSVSFLTTERPFPFAQGLLDSLGIEVEVVPRDTVIAGARVWFCEGFPRDRTHPADIQMIHETFTGMYPCDSRSLGTRVYVSRAKSGRPLRDEPVLERFLESRGFSVVYLEDLPFDEQVRTLNRADIVIGPHGAGLGNVVFMRPGGHVLEIATGECWTNAYRRLAHVRGQSYDLLMLETVDNSEFGTGDAHVAVAELEPILNRLGIR